MESIPCANTSSMPAARAKSRSTCIGLWSPEAPANNASVSREIGSVSRDLGLSMAHHQQAAELGYQAARGVLDRGFLYYEFQRAVLLVINIRDARRERQSVACVNHRMVFERLLAVQYLSQMHAHGRQPAERIGHFVFERKQ